jgi:hypothetical protein
MPRAMNVIFPMEIVIQPNITHIMIEYLSMLRRIYTDGAIGPRMRSHPSWAIPLADGSMRTDVAAMTC